MKIGDLVYVPKLKQYGFVNEINATGRIVTIRAMNKRTGRIDLVQVFDLIVEAVGIVKKLIVIFKMMFQKPEIV